MKREREEEEQPMIVVEGGLRRVMPYWFNFSLNVKQRMVGKSLLQAMTEEFNVNDRAYYVSAIAKGRIVVNGITVPDSSLLKHRDVVSHLMHRHEPPVLSEPVTIIEETDSYVAVNKPASIPVHPTGRYRANSLIELLAHEHPRLAKLYPSNRLDRLTSGIMVLGKTSEAANRFSKMIQSEGAMRKEYVALVHGRFPADPVIVDKPIVVLGRHGGGVCRVDELHPFSKPSVSEFRVLWFDEARNVSLVQCVPRTGRTHQLRVHLDHLGHGIVGDPLYGADAKNAESVVIDSLGNTSEDYVRAGANRQCEACGEPLYEDPPLYRIHLHALRYSCSDFDFAVPVPQWAERPDAESVNLAKQ